MIYCLCCRKKGDPYDDGQDVFGVNYKEYVAWKHNLEIGDRKLPKSYQNLSLHNAARKAKQMNAEMGHKVDGAKTAVSGAKIVVSTKTAKWKEKAVGMHIKMASKVKGGGQAGGGPDAETEDRELIVGDAMAGGQTGQQQDTVVLAVDDEEDDGPKYTPTQV